MKPWFSFFRDPKKKERCRAHIKYDLFRDDRNWRLNPGKRYSRDRQIEVSLYIIYTDLHRLLQMQRTKLLITHQTHYIKIRFACSDHYLKLNHPWAVTCHTATQEFTNISCNPIIHFHVHKGPPLVFILHQIEPFYIISFSKIHFNVIFPLMCRY
jgi:hypothetical protein